MSRRRRFRRAAKFPQPLRKFAALRNFTVLRKFVTTANFHNAVNFRSAAIICITANLSHFLTSGLTFVEPILVIFLNFPPCNSG